MIFLLFLYTIFIFEIFFALWFGFVFVSQVISQIGGAPFVPLPKYQVRAILDFAGVTKDDILYDLGSGDGRILIEAVEHFGIEKATGYEIAPWPYILSRIAIKWRGLEKKITIIRKNFFEADLQDATVVFLYLFPAIMKKLAQKLQDELNPGSKIICAGLALPEKNFNRIQLLKEKIVGKTKLFLYQKV